MHHHAHTLSNYLMLPKDFVFYAPGEFEKVGQRTRRHRRRLHPSRSPLDGNARAKAGGVTGLAHQHYLLLSTSLWYFLFDLESKD